MHGQVAGVATHHFEDEGAVVGTGGQLKRIKRAGANLAGGGKADRSVGNRRVVVDRLRNADHFDTGHVAVVADDVHAAVAADDNQSVKPQFAGAFAEFLRKGFHGFELNPAVERTEVGTAQARPRRIGKTGFGQHFVFKRAVGEPVGAEFDAVNFPAFERGGVNDRTDDGVQAGTVAAAG